MSCNKPITGYRCADGSVRLDRKLGYYDRPVSIACGQCTGCRLARAQAWALRCVHEAQMYSECCAVCRGVGTGPHTCGSCFVTLTYDDDHLPDDRGLHVSEIQSFIKAIRNAGRKVRYYACGEYGEQNLRPHFHGLLFGVDFRADRVCCGINEFGDRRYLSEELRSYWKRGNCELGSVTWQSAAYCAGYIVTKGEPVDRKRKYRRCDGEREWFVKEEFAVMSRRPGIGASWFDKYYKDAFPSDYLVHAGRKRRVPKFYDKRMNEMFESYMDGIKAERVLKARKARANLTPERLEAREFILNSNRSRKGL